jgi:hypothetical protein
LAAAALPTVLVFVLNSERMQNAVAQRVTAMLSEKLGNRVSFDHIRVSWISRVTITNLLVTDLRSDTILTAPELIVRLNLLAFSSKNIEIRKAVLNNAGIRFAIDPETDDINIKFIVDRLKSTDTTANKPKWTFAMQAVELNECSFSFTNAATPFDRPFGMNYAGLDVSHLNLAISGFRLGTEEEGGGVAFRIRRLACMEKCGLNVNFFSADFLVNSNNLSFKDVRVVLPASELAAKDISFRFGSFQDFGNNGFVSKVMMSIDIEQSILAFDDLSHFVPYFKMYSDSVSVAGNVTGTVEDMRGKDMDVSFGEMSHVRGDFDLKDLPNPRPTWIYADITELLTCPSDIERVRIPKSRTGHVNLPETMQRFSIIGYKGNFTGFFDDFVAYGTFTTNLGNLKADVSIKPSIKPDANTSFTFHGDLSTEQFHLGKLLVQPNIGEITMAGKVDGSASSKGSIHADIQGDIGSIGLRGYTYRDIDINGTVNNRMYDGQLSISEPNIKMEFSGKVDLTNPVPAYDFWADVKYAKLHNLKLIERDTSSFAAFTIKAAFSGTNIDNLMGELELKQSHFRRNSKDLEINNLLVFTKKISDTNRFILRSDILDAEIWGQYQFLKLPQSFSSLVKNYAPAWGATFVSPDSLSYNNFRVEAEFKDTEKLTGFFVNDFHVSRGTRLEGVYNPAHRDVHFTLNVPQLNVNGRKLANIHIEGNTEDTVFMIRSRGQMPASKDTAMFRLLASVKNDSASLDIRWHNRDSLLNRGNLSSAVLFTKVPERTIPAVYISSLPGRIVTSGEVWTLTHQGVLIDSSAIRINNIRASKQEQEILVSGTISHREEDKLEIKVQELKLPELNTLLQLDQLSFGGIANGTASLSNLYDVPVFMSDLHIDDFSLNDGLFGRTELKASWNSTGRSVSFKAESVLNDLRTLWIDGSYYLTDQALNVDIALEKVPITVFQRYINMFTGMDGLFSTRLKLTGNIGKPLLNGEIDLQRAAFTLDFTKTRYNFSGNATIKNNGFLFKDLDVYDRLGNLCKVNGSITTEYFKKMFFDLKFDARNLEALNTREHDNSAFYGNGYATGKVSVYGSPDNMRLDINARTERNTQLNIPLAPDDEVAKTTFISFVDHTPKTVSRVRWRQQPKDPRELQAQESFVVNISLDVTPDAEAQLIFDPKVGDIMRARGSGNLKFNIVNSRFDGMFGTYTIEEGDYLFTLNILNKKFTIEKGGLITWNGDPSDALINIKALYATQPSLYDLMGESNSSNFKSFVPVECVLHISNKLTNPNIRFEILMPNAEQEVRAFLGAATNTEEEMTRQFLSLLFMNRFYTEPNVSSQNQGSGSAGFETMGLATASEFLTSQLSYMISQWSNNFDVDFKYHPGTDMTGQNIGMGVNTNMWSFHMDYEVGGAKNAENPNNMVGDVTFDIKLNKSGKLRFKAFNRSNERYQFNQSLYTQGIGLLFREDFNRFRDLFRRKGNNAAVRREEEADPGQDNENNPSGEVDRPATASVNTVTATK